MAQAESAQTNVLGVPTSVGKDQPNSMVSTEMAQEPTLVFAGIARVRYQTILLYI